jgi:CRISPR-associated endonuclease/helicase Cas3
MDKRPAKDRPVDGPHLLVLGPAPVDDAPANWIKSVLPGTAAVYRDPAILWSSMKALAEAGAIVTCECAAGSDPASGSVRWLIERVYGAVPWRIPSAIVAEAERAEGERKAERSQAGHSVLSVYEGYWGANQPWDDDARVRTRLGDDLTLRLGVIEGNNVVPFYRADASELARDWALSEVSVRRNHITGVPEPFGPRAAVIERAKASWSRYDLEVPLLILEAAAGGWQGDALNRANQVISVTYSRRLGLSFQPKGST